MKRVWVGLVLLAAACSAAIQPERGYGSPAPSFQFVSEDLPRPQQPDCETLLPTEGTVPYSQVHGVFVLVQSCVRRGSRSAPNDLVLTTFNPETGRLRRMSDPCLGRGGALAGRAISPVYTVSGGDVFLYCGFERFGASEASAFKIDIAAFDLGTEESRVTSLDLPGRRGALVPSVRAISIDGEVILNQLVLAGSRGRGISYLGRVGGPEVQLITFESSTPAVFELCEALADVAIEACRVNLLGFVGRHVFAEATFGGANVRPSPALREIDRHQWLSRPSGDSERLPSRTFVTLIESPVGTPEVASGIEVTGAPPRHLHDFGPSGFATIVGTADIIVGLSEPPAIFWRVVSPVELFEEQRIVNALLMAGGEALVLQRLSGELSVHDLRHSRTRPLLDDAVLTRQARRPRNSAGGGLTLSATPDGRLYLLGENTINYIGTLRRTP